MLHRRGFMFGLGCGLIAAPAVVKGTSLMQVRGVIMPPYGNYWRFRHLTRTDYRYNGIESDDSVYEEYPVGSEKEAFAFATHDMRCLDVFENIPLEKDGMLLIAADQKMPFLYVSRG